MANWDAFTIDELNRMLVDIREAIRRKKEKMDGNRVLMMLNGEIWEIIEARGEDPNHIWKTWTRRVKGLDKTKDDAYSLLGEFVTDKASKKSYWNKGDIFVHCVRQGPWNEKRRYNVYRLFYINEKGEVELVAKDTTRSWAVNFWEPIEELLNGEKPEQE